MADTDDPNDAGDEAQSDTPVLKSPSERWLDGILWSTPPSTSELAKFQVRARAKVPKALTKALFAIDRIEVLGVPEGARVIDAEQSEPGVWQLANDGDNTFDILPVPNGEPAEANLTIKVSGRETGNEEMVFVMGGINVEIPTTRRGPLFAELPDMVKARKRKETDEQAYETGKKSKTEATAKATMQKEAVKKVPPIRASSRQRPRAAAGLAPIEEPSLESVAAPESKPNLGLPHRYTGRAAVTLQPVTSKESKTAHTTEPKTESIEPKTRSDRLEPEPTTAEPAAPGAENLEAKTDPPSPFPKPKTQLSSDEIVEVLGKFKDQDDDESLILGIDDQPKPQPRLGPKPDPSQIRKEVAMEAPQSEPLREPVAALTESGTEARDVSLAERMIRAEAMKAGLGIRHSDDADQSERTNKIPRGSEVVAGEGLRIRESFLMTWKSRAKSRIAENDAIESTGQSTGEKAPRAETSNIRLRAVSISHEFLTTQLKSALDLLTDGLTRKPGNSEQGEETAHEQGTAIVTSFLEDALKRPKLHIIKDETPTNA